MIQSFFGDFAPIVIILGRYWWLWVGPLFFVAFERTWLSWRQALYKSAIEWTLLEIKIPRQVGRSPKAMDQFFAALHTVRNEAGDLFEKYRDGEVTLWFSLELVSFGGEIHFFIRTPKKHAGVITANIYANYPSVEIEETEDYLDVFPRRVEDLQDRGLDMYGSELKLGKADALPIRTYTQFEDALDETRDLDPIASVLEVFSKIKKREHVCTQILIRPASTIWREKTDKLVKELREKGIKKTKNAEGDEREDRPIRTPGETDLIKLVEANAAKAGYETVIRYVYLAPKVEFDEGFAKRGIVASFNQYAGQNLNYFTNNNAVATQTKWNQFPFFFTKERTQARKERLYRNFLLRRMPEESGASRLLSSSLLHWNFGASTFIMSTEELATLFHPPTDAVLTAPILQRVDSKRLGPSAGLPIFREDAQPEK